MSKQKKRETQLLSHMALLPSPLPTPLCLEATEGGLQPPARCSTHDLCEPELTCNSAARVPVISDYYETTVCVCRETGNLRGKMGQAVQIL